ncbi:UNVERIFIED_CONTAM: Transcription factor [Sesamum calycinum]|uniref:Transcription factor n=1 Tax=Sesamum calycinum TaxID=2727403 RepID=A0AAW2MMY9_9LAMI
MDKVLSDAIKYLEYLQQRVKMLEEQAANQTPRSVEAAEKPQKMVADKGSAEGNSGSSSEQRLPEIEARFCNNNIRLKIQCEKVKGVVVKILDEVETLNLGVVSASVAPFGSSALDISIIAEMDKEFSMLPEDVVTALQGALQATVLRNIE